MNGLQPGDVVCLKSGGPDMTVEAVTQEPGAGTYVTCVWFANQTLARTSLPVSALVTPMWPVAA